MISGIRCCERNSTSMRPARGEGEASEAGVSKFSFSEMHCVKTLPCINVTAGCNKTREEITLISDSTESLVKKDTFEQQLFFVKTGLLSGMDLF